MKPTTKVLLLTFCSLFWLQFSQTASASELCVFLKTAKDVINCALINHPSITRNRARLEQTQAGVEKASQRINPELDGKWMVGQSLGDINTSVEVSVLHTIEMGGKRSSRMDLANSQVLIPKAEATRSKELVFTETAKNLYRAKHIKDELQVIDEIISTFREVLDQYRKRPKLSPEQQVSSSILSLAESDFLIKKNQLKSEWAQTIKALEIATSNNFGNDFSLLPDKKIVWPKVTSILDQTQIKGSDIESTEAALEISKSEYELAKAESYPDLKIGPTAAFENQGGVGSASLGVSFSLPLQILSLNGGARAMALKSISAAEVDHSLRRIELRSELNSLIKKYTDIVEIIQSQPSKKQIDKMHRDTKNNFSRGVVSSALLLESHRQLLELLKDQNQYELEALETLFRISILKGEPLEAFL